MGTDIKKKWNESDYMDVNEADYTHGASVSQATKVKTCTDT